MMDLNKFYDRAYIWLVDAIPKIVLAIVVVIIGQWLIKQCKKWANNLLLKKKVSTSLRPFLLNFLFTILQVLLVLVALQILGVQMTVFTAVLGAFGVASGLALSGTLQNFTSGIMILLFKPFKVGDNIIAQGQEGTVTAIEIFSTIIRSYDNRTVIVPNSKLSNEIIININKEGNRRLDIEFKLPFNIAFEEVSKIVQETWKNNDGTVKEKPPRVGVSTIENDGYKIMINVWFGSHGFHDARLSFQQQLLNDLKTKGIKLPGL